MSDDRKVPRLPRGRGMRWMWADLFRIAFLVTMLVALIAMKDTCSQGVADFFRSFEPQVDAGPPEVPEGYELLTPERAAEIFAHPDDAGPMAPAATADAAPPVRPSP